MLKHTHTHHYTLHKQTNTHIETLDLSNQMRNRKLCLVTYALEQLYNHNRQAITDMRQSIVDCACLFSLLMSVL